MKITYISNAGIMIEAKGNKLIIDGLNNSSVPIYKEITDEIRNKIIMSKSPYDNISVLLYTHEHNDHFDLNSTKGFIKNNPDTYFISNNEVISNLDLNNKGIKIPLTSNKTIHLNEIKIKAYSLLHDGREYEHIHNIGYLIEIDNKKILHVGDAKPAASNYNNLDLKKENIDLLIVPFPYVAIPTGRKVIENFINPKRVALIHFPYLNKDRFGWIQSTKKNYLKIKDNFVDTIFFEEIGQSINI